MGKLEVLCLGTGTTETCLYTGNPSSNYVLLLDGYPVLLIGCGAGTIRQCMKLTSMIPECILLLESAMEQTLELATLLLNETSLGRKIRIFGSHDTCVAARDLMELQLKGRNLTHSLVTFVTVPVAADGTEQFFSLVHDISVLFHQYEHPNGLITNGAVLCFKDQTFLSLTGPIPFDAPMYAKLCQSCFVIAWAHPQGTATSASYNDVSMFEKRINAGRRQDEAVVFLIGSYGTAEDAPVLSGYVSALQQDTPVVLLAGDIVSSPFSHLQLPLPSVRKAAPLRLPHHGVSQQTMSSIGGIPSTHQDPASANTSLQAAVRQLGESPQRSHPPSRPASSGSGINSTIAPIERGYTEPGPDDHRKIYVFSNEDKGRPGKLMLLSHFRNFDQLRTKVAEIFQMRPLKELCYVNGEKVASLEEIPGNAELIGIKRAGMPYDHRDLPRLLKTVKRKK